MQIKWSFFARDDYAQNIEFLVKNWDESVAIEFINEVEAILKLLSINPEMYPETNEKGVRKGVVRKQISILYEVDNDCIILLRFWNNYKAPQQIKG